MGHDKLYDDMKPRCLTIASDRMRSFSAEEVIRLPVEDLNSTSANGDDSASEHLDAFREGTRKKNLLANFFKLFLISSY